MVPTSVHFRHHKSAKCRLGVVVMRRLNLDKVVCVELTTNFCQFPLEWIGFSCKSGKNWSLVIGWSWDGCGHVCRWVPIMGCVVTWSCRWEGRSSIRSCRISVTARRSKRIRRSSSATGMSMTTRSPWMTTWHAHGRWRIRETGKQGITFGHGIAGAKCWRIQKVFNRTKKNKERSTKKKSKTNRQCKGAFSILRKHVAIGKGFMATHAHDIRLKVRPKWSDISWKQQATFLTFEPVRPKIM